MRIRGEANDLGKTSVATAARKLNQLTCLTLTVIFFFPERKRTNEEKNFDRWNGSMQFVWRR